MEVLGKSGSHVILGHDDRLVGFGIDYGKYTEINLNTGLLIYLLGHCISTNLHILHQAPSKTN